MVKSEIVRLLQNKDIFKEKNLQGLVCKTCFVRKNRYFFSLEVVSLRFIA